MGLSTDKPFKGRSVHFYIDGGEQILEVDLEQPMPTEKTEIGTLPGLEQSIFFKHLKVEYPEEVEGHLELFVTE